MLKMESHPAPRLDGWTAGPPGPSLISSSAPTVRFDLRRIECRDRPWSAGVHEGAERRVQR